MKPVLAAGLTWMRAYGGLIRRRSHAEGEADAAFRVFARSRLDPDFYLRTNPDVAAAGVEPVRHWLEYGLQEGRLPFEGAIVRRGDAAKQSPRRDFERHVWRGEPIAVFIGPPVPPAILRQIRDQARHEPAMLAAGSRALPNLRRIDATDLLDRNGIDFPGLFSALPEMPSSVIVIPFLIVGGAEKYAADLVAALLATGGGPVLVLVTEQTAEAARGWQKLSILAAFQTVPVIFWRDVCSSDISTALAMFGRFLHVLRPKRIIVINSRIGLDAVVHFGRGLSQASQLVCAFFSMGIPGVVMPFGCRYPRRTWSCSLSLTDNTLMAEQLRTLYTDLPGPGVAVLPPSMLPADEAIFAARLKARRLRATARQGPRSWLWVSRVERFKGTAILRDLALLRPADRFDVFGPLHTTPEELGLVLPNISCRGVLADIGEAKFADYDGFLFTSLFEGMPNAVLEVSQHAIPMVLADVGGLRDTFDDTAAKFVQHRPDAGDTAAAFARALDEVADFGPERALAMAASARRQVVARHAPAAHARRVAEIFGL
jgi:glycosyltransferase involved in cell wall biosynthesis